MCALLMLSLEDDDKEEEDRKVGVCVGVLYVSLVVWRDKWPTCFFEVVCVELTLKKAKR